MPFFGGDVDMDSLDILLLVTSLEKEFGIKVPNAAVGRQVFENVMTLATFVQEQKSGGGRRRRRSTTSRGCRTSRRSGSSRS